MVYKIPPFWLRQSWLLPPRTHDTLFKNTRKVSPTPIGRTFCQRYEITSGVFCQLFGKNFLVTNWTIILDNFFVISTENQVRVHLHSFASQKLMDCGCHGSLWPHFNCYGAVVLTNRRVARIETKCLGFNKLVWIGLRGLWLFFMA